MDLDPTQFDPEILKHLPRERLVHVVAIIFCRQIPLQACEAIAIEGFREFWRVARKTQTMVRLDKDEWRAVFHKIVQYVQLANQDRVTVKPH